MFWSLLALGVCMCVVALFYVIPGYAVPWQAWLMVVAIVAVAGSIAAWTGCHSADQAANYADQFFGLKDSVSSCSHFAQNGHTGGFYDLQANQTETMVKASALDQIRYRFPWRLAALASLFLAIAVTLGFKGPSKEVVERLAAEKATLVETELANEELRELIEELDKATEDEAERKLLEPDKLRKWVDELEKTKDLKESMRQYARLEMKLNKAAQALNQRKDEKLLDKVAEELRKAEELKELADKLKQKKYDGAAKDLDKMKPRKLTAEDLKNLSEKRKELAKLKAATKRMAAAARRVSSRSKGNESKSKGGKQNSSNGENGENSSGKSGEGESGENGNGERKLAKGDPLEDGEEGEGEGEGEEGELGEILEELEDAVEALDEELEELERIDPDDFDEMEDWDDADDFEGEVMGRMDDLGDRLRRMGSRRRARSKLKSLSRRAAQAGAGRASSSQASRATSNQPGGKKAGEGSAESNREERDDLIDNGQNTKLKGLKGEGPSLTKVESAEDGTGVSGRRGVATKREFKRQFESFVEREDVPEDLKTGVKNYFTKIHDNEKESK